MFKIITTGYFYADGGAMFGAIPKATWNRSYPADARNLCVLAMHAGVVATGDGRIVVVDPGVGHDRLNDTPALFYRFHNTADIGAALYDAGIRPEEVTDVVFTHLHFDHCGAAVRKNAAGAPELVFPHATHWASRAQYESERRPHPLEATSFLPEITDAIDKAGRLQLIESAAAPCASLRMQLYDGHTRGQIVACITPDTDLMDARSMCGAREELDAKNRPVMKSLPDNAPLVFPGDVIPLASHIVPERISAYDLYPTLSYDGKVEILEKAASAGNRIVFYHDAGMPCAAIKKTGSSYKVR